MIKKWYVYIKYKKGNISAIDSFDSQLKAFKFKRKVMLEYWVEKGDIFWLNYE